MPDLTLLIRKHGKIKGRRIYNEFHRAYRRKNRKRINARRRENWRQKALKAAS